MKHIISQVFVFFCLITAIASCQKAPELTMTSPANIELSADGSNGSITFTANRAWRASSSDSWVTVSPSSGEPSEAPVTVSVRCNANTTYEDRTATVTITMEDLSQSVTVRQPANKGIVLPTQSYDLQSGAKTIDVTVQANVDYTVEVSANWIKQTGTKALTSRTLTFSIDENTTYDNREGKITIKPIQAGVAEQIISVKQAQKDALIVEKTSYDMPCGGGEIEIKVEANIAFNVTPDSEWLHHVSTKSLSSSTILIKVDENTTYSSREGTIEIAQQNGSLKHTITVKQAGRIAVSSVRLDKKSLTLRPEDTATLVATVKPDNATDKTVSWTSSDAEVATVDETGKVTAIKDGSAIITARAGDETAECKVRVQTVPDGAVDLGVVVKRKDGSTYKLFWAKCNLGASAPEEYGDYYSWGEIKTKEKYLWETYKWANGAKNKLTKYSLPNYWDGIGEPDNKTVLDLEDDVAHVKLGGNWRMPTKEELEALVEQCTWNYVTINGIKCFEVKSKVEGNTNTIYFPPTGNLYDTSNLGVGNYGCYWSSSLREREPSYAQTLSLDFIEYANPVDVSIGSADRESGCTIRAVTE